MDNLRNAERSAAEVAAELGIRPLNARSVVLSALLGSHPPELPVRSLVVLGDAFDIPPGTVRTALSRMTAAGEVSSDGGHYRLAGRLLMRQREQDAGRTAPSGDWDGRWWSVTAPASGWNASDQRRFRAAARSARLGELRPGTWMRPANLAVRMTDRGVVVVRGHLDGIDGGTLAASLWDLDAFEVRARELGLAVRAWTAALDGGDDGVVAPAFTAFAACLQFLRTEPQLPDEVVASPAARSLREGYAAGEPLLQTRLRALSRHRH